MVEKHRETKHKNGYSFVFQECIPCDSEDGNESEINVQPNPPKKHFSSSTSEPPSKSGSRIRRYKKVEETFPG